MFGMLEDLTKAAVRVAALPVSIAADVATFGGMATDRKESYTEEQIRQIKRKFEEAVR